MTFLLPEDQGEQVPRALLGSHSFVSTDQMSGLGWLVDLAKLWMKKTGEDHMILTPFPRGLIGLVALSVRSKLSLVVQNWYAVV